MIVFPCREFGIFKSFSGFNANDFYLQYGFVVERELEPDEEDDFEDIWVSVCWLTEEDAPGDGGPVWFNNYITVIV